MHHVQPLAFAAIAGLALLLLSSALLLRYYERRALYLRRLSSIQPHYYAPRFTITKR